MPEELILSLKKLLRVESYKFEEAYTAYRKCVSLLSPWDEVDPEEEENKLLELQSALCDREQEV